MPKIRYRNERFGAEHQEIVDCSVSIIAEYQGAGIELTLRQLYYQHVARGFLANRDANYKKLGEIVQRARYAGLIDWLAIVDRTRNAVANNHWDSPADILNAVSEQYEVDKWSTSQDRVEVWVEKDALVGIVRTACRALDTTSFSCRGYTSASEVWVAAQRMIRNARYSAQRTHVIHLGDHDPSGIDMSRDIETRLREFMDHAGYGDYLHFKRIALNMDQVERYNPPPNPAKVTDSRAAKYIERYGDESWELDALDPRTLSELITSEVEQIIDREAWDARHAEELAGRRELGLMSSNWDAVRQWVEEQFGDEGEAADDD